MQLADPSVTVIHITPQPRFPDIVPLIHEPLKYGWGEDLLALAFIIVTIAIIAIVVAFTLPFATMQKYPILRGVSSASMKRRYLRKISEVESAVINNTIDNRTAYTTADKHMRGYLTKVTGLPVHNYDLHDIQHASLTHMRDIFLLSYDGKYAPESPANTVLQDLGKFKECIRRWD